ncbi:AraC family transcriptional regulator [Burkholderia pseudomultivorans]|uniref:AraC family transcriptional regulator n=1 Tax=Burkholderia pseudomultivorans TaxID=1207504 RepID=A0A6P2MU70_9BURK|nr:AraC family transcriptional regulator [Burkholderia pseudomultivorans]VWB85453.1 AraC family transcriptional regulator [Burkholderia pseudomultivorans]
MDIRTETIADAPPNIIRGLTLVAREHGIAVGRLFRGLGFSLNDLERHDILVSYAQSRKFLQRVEAALPGVPVGLKSGMKQTILCLGLVGLAMYAFRTYREALSYGIRHQQTAGALTTFSFEESPSYFRCVVGPKYPDTHEVERHWIDEAFATIMTISRNLLGAQFKLSRVDFTYPRPAEYGLYEEVFGCPVRFDARQNVMTCPPHCLDLELPTWHPSFSAYVLGQIEPMLRQPTVESDFIATTRRYLRANVEHSPGVDEVARFLNVSSRTLRRHLESEGFRFLQLLDEIRLERVQELRHMGWSWGKIAESIGYDNPSNFSKAYVRWTGQLPSESDAGRR